MIKSWFGWLVGKGDDKVDRRKDLAPRSIETGEQDFDPVTGALRWDRFMTLLDVEQTQTPGVLLLIDLSTKSGLEEKRASARDENLPWLAQAIRQAIRSDDLLAHVSGYRFAVLLRGSPLHLSEAISTRILESVEDTIFLTDNGIAEFRMSIGGVKFDGAVHRDVLSDASAHLNQAQQSGKPAVIQ